MTGPAHRRWISTIVAVVCALVASTAAADQVDYQADAGCPDRGSFLQAAARKSASASLTAAGPLKVQLRATPGGYTGVLERRGNGGARVLSGARCEEVADALALTLALSLVPPRDEPPAVVAAVAPPPLPARGRAAFTLNAGLRGGGGVSGEPMMGVSVGVGLSRSQLDEARSWNLALEGGVRLSWNRSDVAGEPARARFELVAASLDLCPVHAGMGRARASLCGLAEAGILSGRGIDVAHPRWGRSAWLALGGGLQLELALTRRWQVVASGQVAWPLLATRFVFTQPDMPVARTAGVVPSATLALAARFP
jgi:hypothetical protein